MRTRKREYAEVNANDSPKQKLARRPNRDQENASVSSAISERSTEGSSVDGLVHEVLPLQPKYVTYAKPSYSVDPKDIDPDTEDEERYDGRPAEEFPEWPYVISEATAELVTKYSLECAKRDQENFGMYVYNDFTGYGIQEVIESQLVAFNSLMNKRQLPADELAHGLWVRLSAFAHWTHSEQLMPWFMIDDSQRWKDTVALIGIAILTTLNALDRANLLMKQSPIKDLGLVLALLGHFICDCLDMNGTVPYLSSNTREVCWPYKIVSYAKAGGIEIKGVHGIEERFVQRFDDEDEANYWKRKECVDRWGWGTKWRIFVVKYGRPRYIISGSRPILGGDDYDITSWPAAKRRKYHFDGKDPLDPENPLVLLE